MDGTFTKLPGWGTLRTSPVLDFQGGGCRRPLTEVKLLSLPVGTSEQPPPQLRERERCELQVAGKRRSASNGSHAIGYGHKNDMKAATTRNGRSPRNGAEARPLRRVAALSLLFNGLLLACALFEPAGNRVSAIVVNVAGFVGPLLVLPLCFGGLLALVWRRGVSRTDNQTATITGQRLAPVLLGMGILCYVLGQMYFTFYDLVLEQIPPFPSIADVGYLMEYPFFLLGILLLPARPIPVASRARIALDGLMIMTAALTFSWYFILGPVIQQGSGTVLAKAISAAYPLADIVLIACLIILALRPGEHTLRVAAYLLALGLLFVVVLDSIYGYQTLNDAYVTGTILDVGWPLAYMLIGLGAFVAECGSSEGLGASRTAKHPHP